jgi:hypothetical protein
MGQTVQRRVNGFGNSTFRLSANLFGAPALTLKKFAGYNQDGIIGVSIQVSAPASQYDSTRLVNIGTRRWSFNPEVGISKRVGRWTSEGASARRGNLAVYCETASPTSSRRSSSGQALFHSSQ